MTPQALKASILQLAIQGKLVPQRPEEGTAEELYQQIQAEKQRLIAEGTIKKEKSPFTLKEENISFDIPETWKWVPFGSIVINRDSERIPLSVSEREKLAKTFDYYGASGVIDKVDKYIFDKPLLLIGEDGANLLMRSKPIAFIARGRYWVNNHAHVLDVCEHMAMEYLELYINAISLAPYVTGTAQPKMNQEKMNSIPVALPPYSEQLRIINKVKSLMPLVERYGEAYEQLQAFNKRFPDDLRKSILQEAIQGKLVPQLPEEGTAEELYQQIQTEKKRLIAEGKIKKEKPLPPIEEKDIPFDIPETWKWVRLRDICITIGAGMTPLKSNSDFYQDGNIPWILTGDLPDGEILEAPNKVTEYALNNTSLQLKPSGSVLIAMYGATIGKLGILTFPACMNQACCCLQLHQMILNKYVFYYLRSIRSVLKSSGEGGAQPNISKEKLQPLPIPLPPFAEQMRIVAKIEELLTLCKSPQ